jgi:ribonuclease P/MRP protein subunit POP5
MVRLKHRYLLVSILYPTKGSTSTAIKKDEVPDVLQFHAPTPSKFNEGALARLIRDSVAELFGDYGVGKISGTLKGMHSSTINLSQKYNPLTLCDASDLLVDGDINRDRARFS